jgi:DNA (cytosine-5)-methyltransferase 1
MNYYNEWDSFAAEWLIELVKEGLIPPGQVDQRSIADVEPSDLKGFTQCHFFAGIGGWSRALQLAGWSSDRPVWTGSPPCQPFSTAGLQKGLEDERHLWPFFYNLISKLKPPTIFMEQVTAAIQEGWLDEIQTDLETQDYALGSIVLPASSVGAFHQRTRLWIVADSNSQRWSGISGSGKERTSKHLQTGALAYCDHAGQQSSLRRGSSSESPKTRNDTGRGGETDSEYGITWESARQIICRDNRIRFVPSESEIQPLANGIPNRVGVLRGAGNAIVPQAAAEIIKAYLSHD